VRDLDREPVPAPPELGGWMPPAETPELPADLALLGAEIEAAASRRLQRRRRLRRSLVHAGCVVAVGVPLAVSAAAVDLAPASEPVAEVARGQLTWPTSPSALPVRDVTTGTSAGRVCVQDPDCRVPELPSPAPFPLRTFN
jgi:hypothetical protein